MEIKHTVEILTKDIQEIENLVRNLNNSPTPPRIELDLALSKLRNVYELLSMIREDIEQTIVAQNKPVEQAVDVQTEPQPEPPIVPQSEKASGHALEQASEQASGQASEQASGHASGQASGQAIEAPSAQTTEPTISQEIVPPSEQFEKPVPEPKPEIEKQPVQAEIPLDQKPQPKKQEAEILAEKFSHNPSINENIASAAKSANVTSKITGQPIDNIGRNIGINDRFLIIRELFEGDNDNYNQLIQQLDASANAQEAIELLETSFPEASENDGYQLLTQLAKRKFISR